MFDIWYFWLRVPSEWFSVRVMVKVRVRVTIRVRI